jgi:hypothetical protein
VLGHLPVSAAAQAADRDGRAAFDAAPELAAAAREIVSALDRARAVQPAGG